MNQKRSRMAAGISCGKYKAFLEEVALEIAYEN
jgi:hypothetical protein